MCMGRSHEIAGKVNTHMISNQNCHLNQRSISKVIACVICIQYSSMSHNQTNFFFIYKALAKIG